jgi:hypothetical protein
MRSIVIAKDTSPSASNLIKYGRCISEIHLDLMKKELYEYDSEKEVVFDGLFINPVVLYIFKYKSSIN